MHTEPKHPQAQLYPSELVTLGLLFALKGGGPRRFYRWLTANDATWFPRLPERTRLFRALATHQDWTEAFLAQPSLLGVAGTVGIEVRHPWREDRADGQIGGKGLSNQRWIAGAKFAYVVKHLGLIVAWDSASANVADNAVGRLIADVQDGDWWAFPYVLIPALLTGIVGVVLLGVAILRSGVLPRWVAALLIIGTVVLLGMNEQNTRVLLVVPFGVAWAVVGYMLWSGRVAAPAPSRPRT